MPTPGGGSLLTTRVAFAVLPVSVAPMNKFCVVFKYEPVNVVVTSTLIVQLPFAATVPLLKLIVCVPAVATSVGVPQPLSVAFAGVAINMLAGRLSMNA